MKIPPVHFFTLWWVYGFTLNENFLTYLLSQDFTALSFPTLVWCGRTSPSTVRWTTLGRPIDFHFLYQFPWSCFGFTVSECLRLWPILQFPLTYQVSVTELTLILSSYFLQIPKWRRCRCLLPWCSSCSPLTSIQLCFPLEDAAYV